MRVTLYSRPGCHLCDDMKAVVTRTITGREGISMEEIDISDDPALLALYALEIPVLMIDERKVAKFRISEAELRQKLDRRP